MATKDGRVVISSSEETYLAGGHFDMDRMIDFVRDHVADAQTKGHCVRTAGWMDWIYRDAPGTERVIEYEARMNLLLSTFDCTFMCVYDPAKLAGHLLVDVIATHPYVMVRGQLRRNPSYIPPETYLTALRWRS